MSVSAGTPVHAVSQAIGFRDPSVPSIVHLDRAANPAAILDRCTRHRVLVNGAGDAR